ncbi:hypothetical protein FZ103_21510 [Streptomonospora sp. PA3]|uniref:hypothetical protein n=1 Tax=Streptomonospora sp. PA3 TaxID=2607326 RepID=UPI0012DBD422|nr:hypothetical protein [Streptomonospora sp. PA3]MUL43709.1 hypothetical protein [Streptomonospora sp. PA3]
MTIGSGTKAVLACAAGGLLAAGCGAGGAPAREDPAGQAASAPHGYVDGAQESAEPQWRLVLADTADGALHVLDPATAETTGVGRVPGVREAATDGRFAYLGTGGSATVLDSGTWTVDHGDHRHYYRTRAQLLGEVDAGAGLHAAGDPAVTALSADDGVAVLDRSALEQGRISTAAVPGGGTAAAYGERLVIARPDGSVDVLDRGGDPAEPGIAQRCPEPRDPALTRRGAVLTCADGALLLTGTGASLEAAAIPYPGGGDRARPASSLHHRPGSSVLAGAAGDEGVWVLDTDAAAWTFIETAPALAVSAAGPDMPVLVLGADGTLRAYDPASGEQTAETALMDPPGDRGGEPAVRIDTGRAYVNDPAADAVYEIDYNDDLRLARTFELGFSPDLMVETGW